MATTASHPSIRDRAVDGPSVWTGADLQSDRSFEFSLDKAERQDLERGLRQTAKTPFAEIPREAFDTPALNGLMSRIKAEVEHGRGFALLRGFPVEDFSLAEIERMYWGLCAHLGAPVTQNGQAGLIHYVTDGKLQPSQGTRGVGKPKESRLHVDLTDCVSLLCVRQAPDNPPSRVGSSGHLFNRLLDEYPHYLPRLFEGFQWDRQGEHGPGESPTTGYLVPFFSERDGVLSCRYNRGWIAPAANRLGQPLSDADNTMFDIIDRINAQSCFEFPFEPGDMQFCNNYSVLHGRAAHAEVPVESEKRLLLRIWVDFPNARPFLDEGLIRYGIVRHGDLGWTVDQVRAGAIGNPRPRNEAGIPIP